MLSYELHQKNNVVYIFVVSGALRIDGQDVNDRDAVGISECESVAIEIRKDTRYFIFEVPL